MTRFKEGHKGFSPETTLKYLIVEAGEGNKLSAADLRKAVEDRMADLYNGKISIEFWEESVRRVLGGGVGTPASQ